MNWFEREESELADALQRGDMSDADFREAMRDLRRDLGEAHEAWLNSAEEYAARGAGWL